MTTESVKTIEGYTLPIKAIGKNYTGNPEEALRFVDIKAAIEDHDVGDFITVKASGYALFKGYNDATNIALFLSDRVAMSFDISRTTGKQVHTQLKKVITELGEEYEDNLKGAEVIYTFKVLEGLKGNYLALVKLEFTGEVKEFESKVEVSGFDSLKGNLTTAPKQDGLTTTPTQTSTVVVGEMQSHTGVDYSKFLNKKVKH
jgi:hypothetical protein